MAREMEGLQAELLWMDGRTLLVGAVGSADTRISD